ncbi:hypothetical protein AB0F03_34390 [Streptomyces sp. NPDC028722]|uniref:hypothetical protein n=1 Tax=Streptomyces sp. NPDC028722 TaxID=3155016 RepID=UPI0033F7A91C
MSEPPVPIPSGSVPPGTAVWSSDAAARWTHAQGAPWARPLWSAAALLITVVWASAATPDRPCGDAAPCGADWLGLAETGLSAGLLYWLVRLPELALIAAPVLAVIVARVELPGSGPVAVAANSSVLLALAFGWAAACARVTARHRQRGRAERAAGVRHSPPQPAVRSRRGIMPVSAGLVLVGVAAFAVVQGLDGIRADQHHADRAARITATVVGRGAESVRVRTGDGRRLSVSASSPEDHRVGGMVTVLEDGRWRRLAAEPYDAFGWQLLILAAGLPGGSMLLTGLLARRRAAALRRAPAPPLRVLERIDDHGRIWIYAGDDEAARSPVLVGRFPADRAYADEPGTEQGDDEADEEEPLVMDTRLREAVMFGSPHEGGELVLATTGRDGRPVVIRTTGPVRLPRPGKGPVIATRQAGTTSAATGPQEPSAAARVPTPLRTPLSPAEHPLRWGPSALARTSGLAMTVFMIAGVTFGVHLLVTEGFGWKVLLLLGPLTLADAAAVQLNWRVTADSSGLWLAGAWKVRHVPWERVRAVRYTAEGSVEIAMTGDGTWRLPGVGLPKAERRLNLCPSYVRMVQEVTALHTHPELRPTRPAPRADRGRPLGPVLLVLTVLAVRARFLG